MQIDLVISRNINGTAVIQSGVKNGNRVVFRHIDLIKDSEASIFRTLVNTSLAELYLVVCERIRSDEICTVCIYMERNIVGGTPYILKFIYSSLRHICPVLNRIYYII